MSSYSCQRIGHGGASALAPANTLAAFDAALDVGIDMVEFDVRAWHGDLVLAHTALHARLPGTLPLRRALAHLSSRRFAEVALNVDVKHPGCEPALLEALATSGLLKRTLLSSQVGQVLDRLHELEPRVSVAISIGGRMSRMSQRWRDWRRHVLSGLSAGRWDALMAQYRLVDEPLLDEVQARGAQLYAWTVNERAAIDRLRAIGVHGITTADPRLFA